MKAVRIGSFGFGLPDLALVEYDDGGVRVMRGPGLFEGLGREPFDEVVARLEGPADGPQPDGHKRTARIVAGLLAKLCNPPPRVGGHSTYDDFAGKPGGPPALVTTTHEAVARWGIKAAADRPKGARWRDALDDDEAVSKLAHAVARDLARFGRVARVMLDDYRPTWRYPDDDREFWPWEAVEEEIARGGVLFLDEEGAAWLAGTGSAGVELAATLRAKAKDRADDWRRQLTLPGHERDAATLWQAWFNPSAEPTPVPWAHFLALALWLDEVGPAWERERDARARAERTKGPAQPVQIALSFAKIGGRLEVLDAGEVQVRGRPTGLVAAPAVDLDALRTMARDLHTLSARRSVYWFARAAWLAYVEGGEARRDDEGWRATMQHDGSVHVRIEGGHERLADLVGETTKKARRVPFDTMDALSRLHLAVDGGDVYEAGALVARASATRGSRAGPGIVEVTLSRWWAVGAVQQIPRGSPLRRLVPVLNVPPMDGIAEVHRPAVAAMEAGALVHLAQRSDELARRGAVRLDWGELGKEAGVSVEVATAAAAMWRERRRWIAEGDGYRLGDDDEDTRRAHELLLEGGRARLDGQERGRAGNDKKRKGPTKHR